MTLTNLLLASALGLWYAAACSAQPFPICYRCKGTGTRRHSRTDCPACRGTGHRLRNGRRLANYLTRTYRDAHRPTDKNTAGGGGADNLRARLRGRGRRDWW
jgi:RecJ-like exonuclease